MRPDPARPSEQESFSQSELQWRAFSDETKERLDALYRPLTKRRQEGWRPEEIVELLRYFQSVKESFLTMTLPNGEAIAQRSEDLLAAVREGRAVLDDPLVGLLQRVADRLKDMRAYAVARRMDAPPAMALTAELDLHRSALGVSAEAAPAPVAKIEAEPPVLPVTRGNKDVVDCLMAQIGDMRAALSGIADILHSGQISKTAQDFRRTTSSEDGTGAVFAQADIIENELRQLRSFTGTLEKAHRKLWETGLQVRAVPIEPLFKRLARSARDFAQTLGKDIDVAVHGAGIQIDKTIVDALADPLTQLVRYAVDQGIEAPDERCAVGKPIRGRLTLAALEVGSKLQITISDDGRGIDKMKVLTNAIERGLLTADDAIHMGDREIYGLMFRRSLQAAVKESPVRVIGIDSVAAGLRDLGGSLEVRTTLGLYAHVVVDIPLSAVLLRTLLVRAAEQIFAVPDRQIISVVEAEKDEIQGVDGRSYYRYRGVAVPLHPLDRLLGFAQLDRRRDRWRIVILSTGTHLVGVVVDEVLRLEDLYLKELHPMLAALPAVAGAAVLGNGRAILVLDAKGLLEISRLSGETNAPSAAAAS